MNTEEIGIVKNVSGFYCWFRVYICEFLLINTKEFPKHFFIIHGFMRETMFLMKERWFETFVKHDKTEYELLLNQWSCLWTLISKYERTTYNIFLIIHGFIMEIPYSTRYFKNNQRIFPWKIGIFLEYSPIPADIVEIFLESG